MNKIWADNKIWLASLAGQLSLLNWKKKIFIIFPFSLLSPLCFKILYQDKFWAGFYADCKRWVGNEAIKPEHNNLDHMIHSCPKDRFIHSSSTNVVKKTRMCVFWEKEEK